MNRSHETTAATFSDMMTASSLIKFELSRMDEVFSAVLARANITGIGDKDAELMAWANTNSDLLRSCAADLCASNVLLETRLKLSVLAALTA